MWKNDELKHFVSAWIFRDSSSVHVRDMEFVNPYVSKAVCDLCQSNEIREKLITRKPEQTKGGQSQDQNVKQGTNFGYVNVESEGKKIMCDTREVVSF